MEGGVDMQENGRSITCDSCGKKDYFLPVKECYYVISNYKGNGNWGTTFFGNKKYDLCPDCVKRYIRKE